jgi:serine/threonine protein kinase
MGAVYRAADTSLGRQVAIKVLPDAFAQDADRLARFEREAKMLASLNHPNIAAIYGFERSSGAPALVMELVQGEDLSQRIARGALPIDEALPIAKQIADALEAAHDQGIIHRDLKPANIKVRGDGTVKVLDFGLAKALAPEGAGATADAVNSPTMTSPAMTARGIILGTAAYMAPEQAKGRAVDKRADIWAFGVVLYEMLTGRRAFAGDDVSDTLANILKSEPDWTALRDGIPTSLRRLLRRCLSKDLAGRLPDIGVARLEIADAMSPEIDASRTSADSPVAAASSRSRWPFLAFVVAVAALFGVLPIAISHLRETAAPVLTVRFSVPPPNGRIFNPNAAFVSPSPDGQHLVYGAKAALTPLRLWLYSVSTQSARELPNTDGVGAAFWSPDSREIAFVVDGKLKRLEIAGGAVQTIAEVKTDVGGSWNRDGTIILGNAGGALMRVSAGGGEVTPVTTLDGARKETGHIIPQFLPDGRRFLFTVLPDNAVRIGSLDSPTQLEVLKTGGHAFYAPPGYLLYARQGLLLAQPFDARSATLTGKPVAIAEGVRMYFSAYALFSVSESGLLAYENGDTTTGGTPVWVDRSGQLTQVAAEGVDNALFPRLSPDGRRLAVIRDGDLWVQDLAGHPPIRLTFDGKENTHFTPLWSLDGRQIVYETQSPSRLCMLPSDGSSTKPTTVGPNGHFHPYGWSSTGNELVAARLPEFDIVALPMASESAPRDVVSTPANEGPSGISMSPDHKWIAYAADSTGQMEIWVRPYPAAGAPIRVSPNGGQEPVWARNGRELFYHDSVKGQLMVVSIEEGQELRFSAPVALFSTREFQFGSQPPSYDVARDGRFLMLKSGRAQPGTRPLTVVLNWAQEVRRATEGR